MEAINIIDIIENNPITTLSQTYNIKLLEKIQVTFSNFEQHLFLSSFYCYLNYNSNDDFIINLDDIWNWLGFGQKVNAKRMLLKNFIENKDYIKLQQELNKQTIHIKGGQNKETFMLNIETFKKFCLKAGTQKADEIHDYYIKLEKIIHDTMNEEKTELRIQLQKTQQSLLETTQFVEYEKRKAIEQTLINQFPVNTECIYFGTIDNTNDNSEKLIKFGHTNNLSVRVSDHRNKYTNFILVDAYKVQNKVEIENLIKAHPKIKKQIRNMIVNDKTKTEIISHNETNFTIDDLKKYIKEIINSRTYSIEKFNKILKENEELLNENEELKITLKNYEETITRQTIYIGEMRQTIKVQEQLLKDDSYGMEMDNESNKETEIVYKNPLLANDETTDKFNEFIDKMCIIRPDVEESSTNMEGSFRIWNKVKPKKEMFHLLKTYLDTRFKHARIPNQNKNQVVHGYVGVKLKPIQYTKKYINDDIETFLFEVCKFAPHGKILNTTLLSEYQRWKQQLEKEICDDDMAKIKEYLNNCEYSLKATVHIDQVSNEGYYGIQLKNDEHKYKTTSSTGKKVEKVDNNTEIVLRTWETIAKSAEDEKISAAKMSRSIKNKIIFNNDYYYRVSN
jgi:hypothetical protein